MKKVIIVIGMLVCVLGNAQRSTKPFPQATEQGKPMLRDSVTGKYTEASIQYLASLLSSYISGSGSDNQQLTKLGDLLNLENGGSVDLSEYADQIITDFSFNSGTNELSITLDGNLTLTLDLSSLAGGGSSDTAAQIVAKLESLSGTSRLDASAIQNLPIDTDNQTLSISGNNLSISDGNTIVIPSTGGGSGDNNLNEFIANTISDFTNPANAGKIACIQSVITLTEDITAADGITLQNCGGYLDLDTYTYTAVNGNINPISDELIIDSFDGTIAGTWNTNDRISASNFGLIGDGKEHFDGNITTGTNILTSSSASFTNADVGDVISIYGALSTQTNDFSSVPTLVSTIVSVTNSNTIVIQDNATQTVANTKFFYGKDNFNAGKNAIYVRNQKSGKFIFNQGVYLRSMTQVPVPNPYGTLPTTWAFGNGTDDISVEAFGSTIRAIPTKHTELTSVLISHFIKFQDTHRSTWKGGILRGEFDYHNYTGNPAGGTLPDEGFHGHILGTATYDSYFENLNIEWFTGDGVYTSGDLQFTNYIKGSNAPSYPGVSEFIQGNISDSGVIDASDSNYAYTNSLIDISGFQFENTRVKNLSRIGRRIYQFSGPSFAGWAGLITPRYKAYYYDDSDIFLFASKEQEFYKTYEFDDNVKSVRLVIEMPLDLTVIDAQVRAPLNPENVTYNNVNISNCGRHGGANLASFTTWQNSTIKNIGNTLPAYGINIEDQRRAARNVNLINLRFENMHAGAINFVGTVDVKVDRVTVEASTDPNRLLHADFVDNGFDRGRNTIITNSVFNHSSISLGRNNVFTNNTVINGRITIEGNSVTVKDNELHNVFFNELKNTSSNNRVKSLVKDNPMTFDKIRSSYIFGNTDLTYDIIDTDVRLNDISRVSSEITDPSAYKPLDFTGFTLFANIPVPVNDFGGVIEGLKVSGARTPLTSRDFIGAANFPITNISNVYSEESVSFVTGFPKDIIVQNFTVDGFIYFQLTQFENSIVSQTPTLNFSKLIATIPEGVFNWTNTNSYILDTPSKNVNFRFTDSEFNLNVASSVIGSSNRFMRLRHLGTTIFDNCTFRSTTAKTIDFTNTLIYPASLGPITIIDPITEGISFILRPQDQIITSDGSGGSTDLSYDSTTREIGSSSGNNVILPEVIAGGESGLQSGLDKSKLDGIESNATADQTGTEIVSAIDSELGGNGWQSSASGLDTSQNLTLDNGTNTSPRIAVRNVFSTNIYELDFYALNASTYIRARNTTAGTLTSINFDVSQLNPATTGVTDFGFSGRRFRNAYLTGTVFASGLSTGGTGSGFLKDNGSVDTNSYLSAPTISQFSVNRTAALSEANGVINFTAGANLTYTIQNNATIPISEGSKILLNNEGSTSVTITPGSGVSLVGGNAVLNTGKAAYIIHVSTDEWLIINLN
ncbi:hypothetical protein [Aquimarina sp. 2201CG14-23]|uniref:hypothetical protein n=1 Tax=Aquimarina mycalae TaxID=3040073 RepID=UPI002477F29D|nr:hypothetical protein [Aquimarina sp. 2201CG14-23]MDH7444687.1 hypothetical protein [Aquimarina sp. 2201CG14-23]